MDASFTRKERSAHEAHILERARAVLPSGARSPTPSPEYAMVVKEASGSRIRDLSGNEYIDYLMGSGPLLLGHANPEVTAAVAKALSKGSSYLMLNENAVKLAEKIVAAVPCAEQVCFNSTGSESTFFAMRLARAYRNRDKILKFEGGFHGMNDYALMSNQWTQQTVDFPGAVPNSAGIPTSVQQEMLIAPFNDLQRTVDIIRQYADELAGVILEPMQRTIVPTAEFLQGLRDITAELDIPLIFDEVVTGYRLALGGAQEYYGVTPDLTALCKGIASGYPISVLCGRQDLMKMTDPAGIGTAAYVAQTGTFSNNPICTSAALACIDVLEREGTYETLYAKGNKLMQGLRDKFARAGIPVQVCGEAPAFQVWFCDEPIVDFRTLQQADHAMNNRFTELLLDRGIVKAHEKFFISLAHTDEDLDYTLDAFDSAIDELAASA
jgi:glutamate-1-semialdehyde 2,1-aminomutase